MYVHRIVFAINAILKLTLSRFIADSDQITLQSGVDAVDPDNLQIIIHAQLTDSWSNRVQPRATSWLSWLLTHGARDTARLRMRMRTSGIRKITNKAYNNYYRLNYW